MKVIIVGGGITGLSAAYELEKAKRQCLPVDYVLIESAPRLGGKILTDRDAPFALEAGPDSFSSEKPGVLELCEELGLSNHILDSDRDSSGVAILKDGRLRALPDGMNFMVPRRLFPFLTTGLLSWTSKLRVAMDLILPRGGLEFHDESAAQFFTRRMGREITAVLVDPFLSGVYAGSAEELSARSALPILFDLERQHRSLILGLLKEKRRRPPAHSRRHTPFVTLAGGLDSLPRAIEARLGEGKVLLNKKAVALRQGQQGYLITLSDGCSIRGDAAIVATPAFESAKLLEGLDSALAADLFQIPYCSSATVTMVFSKHEAPRPMRGFGFLVPRGEGKAILGATFISNKFPGRVPYHLAAIRCFVGGRVGEALLRQGDEEIAHQVLDDLRSIVAACGRPLTTKIHRWMRSNPVYAVGHEAKLKRIESRLTLYPRLLLAGAAFRGVGIPDCIRQGREMAARITKMEMSRIGV